MKFSYITTIIFLAVLALVLSVLVKSEHAEHKRLNLLMACNIRKDIKSCEELAKVAKESCEKRNNALDCYYLGISRKQRSLDSEDYFKMACVSGVKIACEELFIKQ